MINKAIWQSILKNLKVRQDPKKMQRKKNGV